MVSEGKTDAAFEGAYVIMFKAVAFFLFDWLFFEFARNVAAFSTMTVLYGWLAVFVYMKRKDIEGSQAALRRAVGFAMISLFLPLIISAVLSLLSQTALSFGEVGAMLYEYLARWGLLTLMYFFGGAFYWLNTASRSGNVFINLVNYTIIGTIVVSLLLTFFIPALDAAGVLDNTQQDVPDPWEVGKALVGQWLGVGRTVIDSGRGTVDSAINRSLPTHYTGQVERQQGSSLGVYITNVQPMSPTYSFDVVGSGANQTISLRNENEYIQWFGEIQAQTFSSTIPINITCWYEVRQGTDTIINRSYAATPASLLVRYTGQARDIFPFDCRVPMAEIPIEGQRDFLSGQFSTRTNFDFETWGYTTFTFMDAEQRRALQMENKNPAQELGIPQRAIAKYTPGPVSLGMADVSLPVAVEANDQSQTVLPPMGVTIRNAWAGRGQVQDIEYVVLQIPEPFQLEYQSGRCSGLPHESVDVLSAGALFTLHTPEEGDPELFVPEGYAWYVFTGVRTPEVHEFVTLRCPLTLPEGAALLNPDLSPRQFTFVSMVKYAFETQTPVGIGLRLERVEQS